MESQNLLPRIFLKKKQALEKKKAQKKSLLLSHLQNQQRTQQLQQTPPKVIKRKQSNIITGKQLPSKIIKKEINIQQQVFEISNLQEEIKTLNQEREFQPYWNIQTEHWQETTRLGNIVQKQKLEFIKQNNIAQTQLSSKIRWRQNKKWLQIENQSDKQGRIATTVRVSDICTRIAKNFRISRKNFGLKNKKNQRDSIATNMETFINEKFC